MPHRKAFPTFSRRSWESFAAEFKDAHDQSLMEAVVAGCAIVANADGWVTDDERRAMLDAILRFEPVADFGVDDVTAVFEQITSGFDRDADTGERDAMAVVARLRGETRHAVMLVETCCSIAAADGMFDAEERQAAIRICGVLDLDPADFGLAEAR